MKMDKIVLSAKPQVVDVGVPKGGEILRAEAHHDNVVIWYRAVPGREMDRHRIAVCETGAPCPDKDSGVYLGTAQFRSGNYVLHVFEQII